MTTLKQLAQEQLSLGQQIRHNARRLRLASVGLASLLAAERARRYRQAWEMGVAYGDPDSPLGRASRLSSGVVALVREESQRWFDELVAEGEQALAGRRPPPPVVAESPQSRVLRKRPVARRKAPPSEVVKTSPGSR
ncbi:MAG: hypothetical protein SV765_09815 [Pseudomonadota bacterium]|nr:hypothetical protein [Pseudomonadales bacterium]MDY6920495.1 hypothetical protein [Pseudomonadota bacterium]